MIDFAIFGTNHLKAPLEVREKFAFDQDCQLQILAQLTEFVDEIVLLSTCNRTEVIYKGNEGKSQEKIREVLCTFGKVQRAQLKQFFYSYQGREAFIHLFRVVSGLDSMVIGETQILGQAKSAFEFSLKNGYSKETFGQIYQRMLNAAKTVRNQTGISKGSISVGSVAVQLAVNIFENLSDKKVGLIGAGEMCELAAENFVKSGVRDIHVINRSHHKAKRLAEKYAGSAHTLSELPDLMADTDIMLSSISSSQPILKYKNVLEIMKRRRGKLLFIIDIAVPRNVEGIVNNLPEVYLYNIDDLQKLVNRNLKERQREAVKAEELVQRKVDELLNFNGQLAGELILSLQERVTEIRNKELKRLFRRNNNFSAADKHHVEQTVNLIVNKILHDPIISLRRGLSQENASANYIVRRFKDFFNL